MKQSISFFPAGRRGAWRAILVGLGASALVLAWSASPARAENTNSMIKPPRNLPIPGGLGVFPIITNTTWTQDTVTVEWFGIQGPYQLLHATSSDAKTWQSLGAPTFGSKTSAPLKKGALDFFRVLGGSPVSSDQLGGTVNYAGASACMDCHDSTHHTWLATGHATAFETLKKAGQSSNADCLVCHTVGYGTPLGFKSEAVTPHLAGVQCENCHGPAGSHVANPRDPSFRPKVTMAAEVCGGCHNTSLHPTFDEWKTSPHANVDKDVSNSILAQGEARMLACGPCHSGAVRNALLSRLASPAKPLSSREDAGYFGVTCVVCHEPHQKTGHPANLRNPLYSTNQLSYSTAATTSFTAQYKPEVQICAQCHNMRGARWQDTSRPPHHSPQYNMLIGQGGEGRSILGTHGLAIKEQCVRCHVVKPVAKTEIGSGHHFEFPTNSVARFQGCASAGCHDGKTLPGADDDAIDAIQGAVKTRIASVKALLDRWATQRGPALLQSTNSYGVRAWEYTTPGELSNPTGDASLRGPTTAEQARIPEGIKKARMNLYLLQYDGSFGVHNPGYALNLLNETRDLVNVELAR